MSKKKEVVNGSSGASDFTARLAALKGGSAGLDVDAIDATLLWLATTALARRRASITLGVTKDGGSWVCQLWDGSYPVKDYFRDTGELNRHLAALVRADAGNNVSPEVEEILQLWGW
jgi:hypothetical protein